VETIRQAAIQARTLTHQMLAYAGQAPYELGVVDLSRVVEKMKDLTQTRPRAAELV